MIIICKECSTKFRLDESLLKATGSKVRCCVCKHIFTAYPPQALGKTEVSPPLPSQQGYFDSEENVGADGPGSFQKSEPEPDDDGLELDVEEEDEDMDEGGLDLGDDDTGFDDGGIDMGNNMPGMDTGMNFDEDMDTGIELDTDSGGELEDMELDTEINLNLDQGEEIDLDADSDLKKDSAAPETEQAIEPEPEPVADEDLSNDDVDDFEFEFELDEEEKFDIEEDITLDEPSIESEAIDEEQEAPGEEDFELSLDDESFDEEVVSEDASLDIEDASLDIIEESDDSDQYESSGLEIDDDVIDDIGDDEDDNYEIEEVDEFEEDDDYEIEEYEDDEKEYADDDIIDDDYDDDKTLEDTSAKPKKKPSKLFKALLVILLLLCVGYGAFMITGGFTKSIDFSKINFSIVKNLLDSSKMDQIPVWATINNQSLNGRYVNNENTGKLFVITGKITNESTIPLNHVQVEGTLIAKGGVIAKKKKVFCGNKIPEGQLSSLSVGAIERILQRKDGEQGANLNIKANEGVPFMLVFSGLPEELENYTVTVTAFDRMKKK
ncbi:MAG: zinc-ribbon domain-containing protein [Desulfobacteraceae bacterium]|nr:zinc-ribbon domain-containing protein [Desulfobacteraceae bacterium]